MISCSCSASKTSPGFAERQTSSASVSTARPSPSAMRTSEARASSSRGRAFPVISSALSRIFAIASSSSDLKSSTRARDRSAAFSSKDGFSVVAPDERDGAVLHHGQEGVELGAVEAVDLVHEQQRALARGRGGARAASNTFFRSATPEKIAEICSKCSSVSWASSRATVVLPVPGGPQKISEPRDLRGDQAGQDAVGPDQMVLADDFGQVLRPHPVGQRTGRSDRGRRRQQVAHVAGSGAIDSGSWRCMNALRLVAASKPCRA